MRVGRRCGSARVRGTRPRSASTSGLVVGHDAGPGRRASCGTRSGARHPTMGTPLGAARPAQVQREARNRSDSLSPLTVGLTGCEPATPCSPSERSDSADSLGLPPVNYLAATEIGEELATARALRDLADHLLQARHATSQRSSTMSSISPSDPADQVSSTQHAAESHPCPRADARPQWLCVTSTGHLA
ncbi:dsRBD fold-containing protein [Oerskovia sp. Root918]|uniref:dsRBD fold-containing protein n=1 Tax=Oerskovia sp. Root918 TaxID=1736607 RepID=UPI0012FC8461